jgi:hypothetical protein
MKREFMVAVLAAMCGSAVAAPHKAQIEKPPSASNGQLEHAGFDGSWTFEVTTTVGSCPQTVSSIVGIRENRIAAVDENGVAPWGYVDSDGTLVARFTRKDGGVARVHGLLHGSAGSGAWSSSTDMCGGTWRASRSAAEHAGQ